VTVDRAILKRMQGVEQAVLELDESVRGAAFFMMKEYILGEAREARALSVGRDDAPSDPADDSDGVDEDIVTFFSGREIKKPAAAVYAATGYLYSQYGSVPFTTKDIQDLADQVGLTVPGRIDRTLRTAQRNNKAVFRASKSGDWKVTTTGELVLKEMFGIEKGRKKRPVDHDGDA
jgi:hypothetical protein